MEAGEVLDTWRRNLVKETYPITETRKWAWRYQDGGSGCTTFDPCAAKRMGREGSGPIGNLIDKGGKR